jgi:hypothetical protein
VLKMHEACRSSSTAARNRSEGWSHAALAAALWLSTRRAREVFGDWPQRAETVGPARLRSVRPRRGLFQPQPLRSLSSHPTRLAVAALTALPRTSSPPGTSAPGWHPTESLKPVNLPCARPEPAVLDPAPVSNIGEADLSNYPAMYELHPKSAPVNAFQKALGITIAKPSARRCGEVPALSQSEEGLAENGVHGDKRGFFSYPAL